MSTLRPTAKHSPDQTATVLEPRASCPATAVSCMKQCLTQDCRHLSCPRITVSQDLPVLEEIAAEEIQSLHVVGDMSVRIKDQALAVLLTAKPDSGPYSARFQWLQIFFYRCPQCLLLQADSYS